VPGATVRLTARLLGRDYLPLPKGKVVVRWRRGADPRTAVPVGEATVVTVGDDGTGSVDLTAWSPGPTGSRPRPRSPARSPPATSSWSATRPLELDEPTGDLGDAWPRSPPATGGRALGAGRSACRPTWPSTCRGWSGSISAPTSSCGAARC
jgi:hypothetical protein